MQGQRDATAMANHQGKLIFVTKETKSIMQIGEPSGERWGNDKHEWEQNKRTFVALCA